MPYPMAHQYSIGGDTPSPLIVPVAVPNHVLALS